MKLSLSSDAASRGEGDDGGSGEAYGGGDRNGGIGGEGDV